MHSTHIKIDSARVDQIQALAEAFGLKTIASAIDRIIGDYIERGRLPDLLPGFEIETYAGCVLSRIRGVLLPVLPAADAIALANDMDALLASGRPGRKATFPRGEILLIARRGTGYAILFKPAAEKDEVRTSITASMLADIARHLRQAAHVAQGRGPE